MPAGAWAGVRLGFIEPGGDHIDVQNELDNRCDQEVTDKGERADGGDGHADQDEDACDDAGVDELSAVDFVEFGFGEECFGLCGFEGCATLWAGDGVVIVADDAGDVVATD